MRVGVPSGTAQFAGVCRAAHQLVDFPRVLEDPLAVPILGFAGSVLIMMGCAGAYLPGVREMRAYIAARSRYAEDRLAQAVAAGTRQYVILGAGLDTFAYRNPHRGLKIFEVDHPDAQAWKLGQLARARIEVPPEVAFVPADLEKKPLATALERCGLKRSAPAFFSFLGVTPYLSKHAVLAALAAVRSLCCDNRVVFDYTEPREALSTEDKAAHDALCYQVEQTGEPFRSFFKREALLHKLKTIGFQKIETPTIEELNTLYFCDRLDGLAMRGHLGGLICAG